MSFHGRGGNRAPDIVGKYGSGFLPFLRNLQGKRPLEGGLDFIVVGSNLVPRFTRAEDV